MSSPTKKSIDLNNVKSIYALRWKYKEAGSLFVFANSQ